MRLPSRFVESAIALSIAYVAVENLAVREPKHRWLLTFFFGLVHGFGFASVLAEIGLPPSGVVPSLVSFNVGVELGQLTVVVRGGADPVVAGAALPARRRACAPGGSVGAAGAVDATGSSSACSGGCGCGGWLG